MKTKIIKGIAVISVLTLVSSVGFAVPAKAPQKSAASKATQQKPQNDNADFNIINQTTYPITITESGFISSNTTVAKSFVVVAPSQVIAPQKQVSGYRIYQTSNFSNANVQFNMNFGYQKTLANGKATTIPTGQQVEFFLTNGGMARGYVVHNSQYTLPLDKGSTECPVQITLNGSDQFENSNSATTGIFNITITNAPAKKKLL